MHFTYFKFALFKNQNHLNILHPRKIQVQEIWEILPLRMQLELFSNYKIFINLNYSLINSQITYLNFFDHSSQISIFKKLCIYIYN